MTDIETTPRFSLWTRQHVTFLITAYVLSWLPWLAAWLLADRPAEGDVLFNADLVWAFFGEGDAPLGLSLLSLLGVYGPMIAGILATRRDPDVSSAQLGRSLRRVAVGGRWYGLVLGILALVAGPAALIVALTAAPVADAPGIGTAALFLVSFFAFQLLTSGTEEIGWRGYLNEKLRHGRSFWDTGWAVGLPWAVWHFPIVVMIFIQQDMVPVQIIGSLAGFSIGIVAAAILHAWFYERTRSVFLAVFIHAIFNTVPLTTVLFFEDSPAAVIANLALWVVVSVLKSRHDRALTGPATAT